MKVGDKIYCNKNLRLGETKVCLEMINVPDETCNILVFKEGYSYEILSIFKDHPGDNYYMYGVTVHNPRPGERTHLYIEEIKEYFYTEKELRKFKLDEIENNL